jgi:hypothetical protein
MKRRLLNVLTALSLLLCVAAVGLWALGEVWPSDFIVARGGRIVHFGVHAGRLQLSQAGGHYQNRPLTWLPYGTQVWIGGENIPEAKWSAGIVRGWYGPAHGAYYGDGSLGTLDSYARYWSCETHPAAPVLLAAALPVVSLRSYRRRHSRITRDLCPRCRYDIRATPGRCPECGTEAGGVG